MIRARELRISLERLEKVLDGHFAVSRGDLVDDRDAGCNELAAGLELVRVEHHGLDEVDLLGGIGVVKAADVGNVDLADGLRARLDDLQRIGDAVDKREDAHGAATRVLGNPDGVVDGLDEQLLGAGASHLERRGDGGVGCGPVVGDQKALAVELLGPEDGHLAVNEPVVNANLDDHGWFPFCRPRGIASSQGRQCGPNAVG